MGARSPTGAELDPDALLAAVVGAAARGARRARPTGRVAGIGVTSVAETGMLLDADGRRPAPRRSPGTTRAARAEAQALARDLPDFTAAHRPARQRAVLAGQAQATSAPRGAARWLNVAEWVVHRLGGRQVSELSLSSRTGLLDLDAAAPYADALAWAGLPGDLLAELVLAGTDAGRSDGARAARHRAARCSPWPATTTSSPASASA